MDKLIRRLDDLGRIVIPKTVRNLTDLKEGDAMEITITEEGKILLTKYEEKLE